MKILAIKLRGIADTVIWTSALGSLREHFPQAEIHVLTYPLNASILQHLKSVDEIHTLNPQSHFALMRALWGLRSVGFDWLLGFHANESLCKWAWLVGARQMVLHHHGWAYTPRGSARINQPGAHMDMVSRDLEVLQAIGFEPQRRPTELLLSASERDWAEKEVCAKITECGGDIKLPRFVFMPGALHPLKRYPKDLWLPHVETMKREGRYQPLVMCDGILSREWGLVEECARMSVPLFDKGSWREFISLVSRGHKALANDGAPGHIAVALGLQTDFIFGPGSVGDWHPYIGDSKVHRIEVSCRIQGPRALERFQFCTVDQCDHHQCLKKLTLAL